jgi:gamma-glutamylcyclotransferase (GGCT)/AIG2-like uncharacterized protein YtfP
VYGSLRLGQQNPVAALLHRHARHLGPGTVHGRLYVVSWYSGMVAGHADEDVVHGDLFELAAETAEHVVARLDAYEGDGFERRPVEVAIGGETRCPAFAYLYAGSVAGLARVAHGDWLRRG